MAALIGDAIMCAGPFEEGPARTPAADHLGGSSLITITDLLPQARNLAKVSPADCSRAEFRWDRRHAGQRFCPCIVKGREPKDRAMPLPKMSKQTRFHIGYWLAAILGLLVLQCFYVRSEKVASIPYSQFEQLLHDGKVDKVAVSDRYIEGTLKQPLNGKSQFVTTRVRPELASELQKYGVTYTGAVESTFLQDLLSWIVPVALFFGLWMLLARRVSQGFGGGLMSIGKSKAKIYVEADTGVRF